MSSTAAASSNTAAIASSFGKAASTPSFLPAACRHERLFCDASLDNTVNHPLRPPLRRVKIAIAGAIYAAITVAVVPLLALAAPFLRLLPRKGYVLHVGGPSHVLEHSVATLRQQGIDASYLALGSNIYSRNADFRHLVAKNPLVTVYREIVLFLSVVGRFTIVHSHAMVMPSWSLWEIPLLRLRGAQSGPQHGAASAREYLPGLRFACLCVLELAGAASPVHADFRRCGSGDDAGHARFRSGRRADALLLASGIRGGSATAWRARQPRIRHRPQ